MDEEDMQDVEYHLEWRKVQTRSHVTPPLKANSACVNMGGDLYLFGGMGAGQFSDVWRFGGKSLRWEEVACSSEQIGDIPHARDGHTMVKISETKLIIYAGQGGLFDSGKCERATEHGKVKYLSMRKLFDDMFELDISTFQWTSKPRRKVRPLGRRGHSMAYLKPSLCKKSDENSLGNVLLFGGSCLDTSTGFEKVSHDVWTYSLDDEQWTEVQCGGVRPRAVYGHSAVLVDESYVIVGGSYAPPKKEGFISKAKALAPRKKVVDLFSSAISEFGDHDNVVSVLNVTTFQWSSLYIDCIPNKLDGLHPTLNLTGHTAMLNPLKVHEILIFGGRTSENGNNHYTDFFDFADDSGFVAANLYTLNVDECTLKHVVTKNNPDDRVNVPEARSNHICARNIDGHIVLNHSREDAKSKKMKNGRRIFDITAKKKEIVGQPVTLVFGGYKANSPGFCDCSVHELYFVPYTKQKKKAVQPEIKILSQDDNTPASSIKDDGSHISKLSIDTFDVDTRSSTDMPSKLYDGDSFCNGSLSSRALRLKPDCSTQLLSPKRGVDGHYFDLKSSLSYSKSSFVPSNSRASKTPESESLPSTLDPIPHKGTFGSEEIEENGDDTSRSHCSSVLTPERMMFMTAKEIMKTRTNEIAPRTKGMTVHNARAVFNKMYPLPGLPNSFKKKVHNLNK